MNLTKLPNAHYTDPWLIAPTNPIRVNLIGVGGTGSHVIRGLIAINHALLASRHPGLQVTAFDADKVTEANLGRQSFLKSELGMNKADARIGAVNRGNGTSWKACTYCFSKTTIYQIRENREANIFISCVDTPEARFEIADLLKEYSNSNSVLKPYYWMDVGNSRYTGQAIISTLSNIPQPTSKKYTTVSSLPLITDEYKNALVAEGKKKNEPSCSLMDALKKQDLFVNSSIADMGCSLLYNLIKKGMTFNRGFFHDLLNFRSNPIPI